jgi:hypothetical protein
LRRLDLARQAPRRARRVRKVFAWDDVNSRSSTSFGAPTSNSRTRSISIRTASAAIDLLPFSRDPGRPDGKIGQPGFVSVTTRGTRAAPEHHRRAPALLFRMVHSERPSRKMALFCTTTATAHNQDRRRL